LARKILPLKKRGSKKVFLGNFGIGPSSRGLLTPPGEKKPRGFSNPGGKFFSGPP